MDEKWEYPSVIVFGAFAATFGYILVAENALPVWAVLAVIAGGVHGALFGVGEILGPFRGVRGYILRVLYLLAPWAALLLHSSDAVYTFFFATVLVIFAILLRNAVDRSYGSGGD